jgi:hypothetical protein
MILAVKESGERATRLLAGEIKLRHCRKARRFVFAEI